MDQLIYTSLSAMRALMQKQAMTANNLANVNTTGFRGDMTNAQTVYLTPGDGSIAARAQAADSKDSADMAAGANVTTGRDLDVALDGDALLGVQASDGTEAYTRRGDLKVSDSGLLTGDGLPVMGDGGPITLPPADKITIDKAGVISIVPEGGDPTTPIETDHLKLVSAAGSKISKGEDGLFRVADGGALPSDPNARVTSGALEGSNVNVTKTLTDMIDASRSWETQVKMLAGAKDMDSSATQLMSVTD